MTTRTEMQAELLDGELLIWIGQALRQVIFHPGDWYAIPFSLLWGGFAIFWESGVTGHFGSNVKGGSSALVELWGIPFVVIGQYMIWGRFFYTAWRKNRTHYAVTTKRVLVLSTGATRKLVSGYLSTLDSVTLTTRQDGIGTIEFSPEPESESTWNSSRRRNQGPQLDISLSRLAFYDIPEAKAVYGLIQPRERSKRAASVLLGIASGFLHREGEPEEGGLEPFCRVGTEFLEQRLELAGRTL